MEANSATNATKKQNEPPKPRRKLVFGLRDEAVKAREPEADPLAGSLVKKISVNFDELYVAAIANRIYVYESEHLKPIDVSIPLCRASAAQAAAATEPDSL